MATAIVVDDNPKNGEVLARMLRLEGLETHEYTRSLVMEAALNELTDVSVIFLDLEMPGLNGYDVLGLIKQNARFQEVPVVAYTVHVSEINTAYEQGFHSFLAKPLDADKFPEQLARILAGEPVWETA